MVRRLATLLATGALALTAGPTFAHHSFAMFDRDNQIRDALLEHERWVALVLLLPTLLSEGVRSSTRDILKNIHRNSKGLMKYYNSSQIHFPRKLEPV